MITRHGKEVARLVPARPIRSREQARAAIERIRQRGGRDQGLNPAPRRKCESMARFPTSIENIALNLIFESMGESRFNRTFDDYMRIAAELPPLKTLHHIVNQRLAKIAEAGAAPYDICRFRAGDEVIRYERFPTSISIQTIRTALVVSGMRRPKWKRSTY